MVRRKTTKRMRDDPKFMEQLLESQKEACMPTPLPSTASNRRKSAMKRKEQFIDRKKGVYVNEEDNEYEQNLSESKSANDSSSTDEAYNSEYGEDDDQCGEDDDDNIIVEEEIEKETRRKSKKKGTSIRKQASTQPSDFEIQPSLLFAFKDHIAYKIWTSNAPRGEVRIVKVHTHVGTQRLWNYKKECSFVKNIVVNSGFYQLILHAHEKLDKVLINSFIERFYPETNTFHLPFGEMGISIDEVVHITGLPAEGRAVTGPLGGSRSISYSDVYDLLDMCLGIDKGNAIAILAGEKKIRLEWLRSNFEGLKDYDTDERKRHCAIAYLLYTIGCLICCDKSGNKVSVHFLQCLSEISQVHTYSWASACLSWLLHNLGQGTRKDVHQMTGCMTLLQVWIFEHFQSLGRHNRCVGAVEGDVRAAFYFAKEPGTNLDFDLVSLRERIDDIQSSDVVWDCFKEKRQFYQVQQCTFYNGPIICFETVELYLPQRFLRQFGYLQPIPTTAFTLDKKKLKSSSRRFKAAYYNLGDFGWSDWRNHLLNETLTSQKVVDPWDCDEMYMQWYMDASHRLVANPQKRITEPLNVHAHRSVLVRIKRRLRHIAGFIRSCVPSESMNQLLEKVERIEEEEPLELYGETVSSRKKQVVSKVKKTKSTLSGKSGTRLKKFVRKKK